VDPLDQEVGGDEQQVVALPDHRRVVTDAHDDVAALAGVTTRGDAVDEGELAELPEPHQPTLRAPSAASTSRAGRRLPRSVRAAITALTTATPSAPARMTSAALEALMPPMAISGALPTARRMLAMPSSPTARSASGLSGQEDRRHREVVGAVGQRRQRLARGRHRDAEQHLGADQASYFCRGQVVLTNVNAVGLGCERHVDAVVDQQAHTGAGEELPNSHRLAQKRLAADHSSRAPARRLTPPATARSTTSASDLPPARSRSVTR